MLLIIKLLSISVKYLFMYGRGQIGTGSSENNGVLHAPPKLQKLGLTILFSVILMTTLLFVVCKGFTE